MSIIRRLIEDIRGAGRQIDGTTAELFENVEERLARLEEKVLGKDAPKAPPPKPAPKEDPPVVVAPPAPLDVTALPATPGPAASPRAQGKQIAETTALQAIQQSTVQTTNLSEDAVGKGDGPSMAPVPLPNTDALHPVNPADPVKMTAGVAPYQVADDKAISAGAAMPKSDPLVAANTDVEAKTDPRKPAPVADVKKP